MKIDESKFIMGFNAGYLLAEHEPNMISNLLKDVQTTTSYISGMSFGQNEYELEQSKSQQNEIEKLRQKNLNILNREFD